MDRLSYLLGVFDGEGSITGSSRPDSRGWGLVCTVTMGPTSIVCDMLQEQWGGGVRPKKVPEGRQLLWCWYVTGSKSIPFLMDAVDGLIVKRQQAVLGLQIAQNMLLYSTGSRKRVAVSQGAHTITPEDAANRTELMLQLRALNGSRARFSKGVVL